MNKPLIDTARDADLRFSHQALLRAAQRARALALQTGTVIIVSRNGVVEQIDPAAEAAPLSVQAPVPPYHTKR